MSVFGRLTLWALRGLGLRAIPGLGQILLVSDLLNLIGLLGALASPIWAFLCNGPAAALAAGVPAVLFKRALKSETWKLHNVNPLSRKARAARALKAAGGLPTFKKLLEVAQTTEALFGYGLSLGGVVGALTGLAGGAALQAQGATIRSGSTPGSIMLDRTVNRRLRDDHPADLWLQYDASNVLLRAPLVLALANQLGEDEVLAALVSVHQAAAVLRVRLRTYDLTDVYTRSWNTLADAEWPTNPATLDLITNEGWTDSDAARWPLPGGPHRVALSDYAAWIIERVPPALEQWLLARRNTPAGVLAGALINEATDGLFLLAEGDPDLFKWELSTDARLISSLAEEGMLPLPTAPPGPLWTLWRAARHELEATAATSLPAATWRRLLEAHSVPFARLLPPDAPWPDEWRDFLAPDPPSS